MKNLSFGVKQHSLTKFGPSWSWSYNSWIYNNMCYQSLSPRTLWVWVPLRRRVFNI